MTNFEHTTDPADAETVEHPPIGASRRRVPAAAKVVGGTVAVGLFFSAILLGRPDAQSDTPVETAVDAASAPDPTAEAAPNTETAASTGVTDAGFEVVDGDELISDLDSPDEFLGGDQETEDAILAGNDQGPAPDPVVLAPVTPGLGRFCANVVHGQGESGIWVHGSVYGLEDGWIWVAGPTLNGGAPVEIPVVDGAFNSPLPIVQYGDHETTRFELGSEEIGESVDLLPTLLDGPGTTFPVGPDEGSIFDDECFDFTPDGNEHLDEDAPPVADDPRPAGVDAEPVVQRFLDEFVAAHRTGDVDALQSSLHPTIRLAYGDDVCTAYIDRTAGTIVDATLLGVDPFRPHDMDAPGGTITFPEAAPFSVEFTLVDGSTVTNEAHLPIHDGEPHWLTTCGVDTP